MMAPMAMMASPAVPPTALRDATLTGEERTLAAFLQKDIVDAFESTRGSEQRVVVYLALQKVLRLEDTHGSVRVLQRHLPTLLRVVQHDLKHATMPDLVHVALRTLSYFMHHPTLARGFRDDQIESFLTDIMSRLGSAQDEATYKVCLWCLIVQDLDLSRLDFLPRIVEALVLAIINPFQSRPIAVQTLKGLHLLLYKNKHFMLRASALRLWFKPVASRLGSSDKTTRDLAALVLLEAATSYHDPQRDEPATEETDKEIAAALTEYALPTIQTHVTHERHVDALIVWKIVMILMKRVLATDLPLLGGLLSVPEASMVHADASVRLHGVEAWRHLVEVFRQTKDWLFKKPVLVMLMRPIVACLEEETMLNILHASLATWRVLLTAVVEDFNKYATSQRDSAVVMQESAKKWRRWVDEVAKKVVAVAAERAQRPVQADAPEISFEALYDTVETTVRDLFSPMVAAPVDVKAAPAPLPPASNTRGCESSMTTAASSVSGGFESQVQERKRQAMDLSERDDQILDDELLEHSLSAMHSSQASQHAPPVSCPALSGHLVVLALCISDVLALVLKLYQISRHAATSSGRIDVARRSESLAFYVWDGLCTRLKLSSVTGQDDAINKLRLRVTRMALDFSFGTAASGVTTSSMDSQASVLMPSLPTDSLMTAADLIHSSSLRLQGNQGSLPFQWQLRLLREIIDTTTSADELAAMLVHPKIKTSHHLLTRIDGIVEHDAVYRVWLAQWDQAAAAASKDGEKERRIDFSAKKNVPLSVLLYVVMKLAVTFDQSDADPSTEDALSQMAKNGEEVTKAVAECVSPTSGGSGDVIASFLRIVESSSRATALLLERDNDADVTGPGKLLKLCARLAHRSEETEENAEVLLQLQRSPVREVTFVSASPMASTPVRSTVSTLSAVAPSPEPTQAVAPGLSDGSSLPSPCLLQPAKTAARITSQEQSIKVVSLSPTRPSSATATAPTTPQTPSRANKPPPKSATTPSRQTSSTPVVSTASTVAAGTPVAPAQGSVFPELVPCTDSFSNLQHHFPTSFRKLAPLHNIKTVGDLSAMTLAQVMKLGIKDPATTVMKALADYHARKSRPKPSSAAINSPYRPRFSSPPGTSTPGLPSPSPKRIQKRPIASPHNRLVVTPLPLESPQRKRARRTLHELSSELDQAETKQDGTSGLQTLDTEANNELPKIANRVTFRLDLGDGGTKFTRPGEESQEAPKSTTNEEEEKESVAERMQMYVFKMRHHLSRTLSYAEKIGAEENSMQSETSLQADVNKLGKMMQQMVEAHALVTSIGAQLLRVSEEVERAQDAGKRNLDALQPPQ